MERAVKVQRYNHEGTDMTPATTPENENQRMLTLRSFRVLDTSPETAFDEIAELAAELCETPIALVSLVDESRQWFKAKVGLEPRETARSIAFCSHAILRNEIFVVPDTLDDKRFSDNPLVTGPPNIRFYAGAPLFTDDGCGLGTLCVIDKKPREFDPLQRKALSVLRQHVMNLLVLRRQNVSLQTLNEELEAFTYSAAHDLSAPARRIVSFCAILNEESGASLNTEAKTIIGRIEKSAVDMRELVKSLLSLSRVNRNTIKAEKIDIGALAQNILSELKQNDPNRRVETHIAEALYAYGDKHLIRIALENLIRNSWKFTSGKEVGRIEVGDVLRDGSRFFYVKDNGAGFSMTYAKDLFKPFKRLHVESEFTGSGIGLSIVRRIVNRHGGTVFAESEPDAGATFYFAI